MQRRFVQKLYLLWVLLNVPTPHYDSLPRKRLVFRLRVRAGRIWAGHGRLRVLCHWQVLGYPRCIVLLFLPSKFQHGGDRVGDSGSVRLPRGALKFGEFVGALRALPTWNL